MPQIELSRICKHFTVYERPEGKWGLLKGAFVRHPRRIDALNDVSFSMEEGELVGYIGPNGAGKSTSVKVMSGILTPDAGECVINGRVPWKRGSTTFPKSAWCSANEANFGGMCRWGIRFPF